MLYEVLSKHDKAWMCNGCGPKLGIAPDLVPDFIFHEACSRHDFAYWRGCTEQDRAIADKRFLDDMLTAAKLLTSGWWSRQWYTMLAWRYYSTVRWLGKKAFSYRDHYGTRDDLNKEMAEDP
jgi:hypothetical protein